MDTIDIVYYTDPLCCWSWAMEPHWSRLQSEFGGDMRITYRMIGLIPSWNMFTDTAHSLSRPSHMGPEWMQASRISGLPVADRIWITDPPSSSFPACIAVKSAEAQSQALGAAYLQAAREAVMTNGRNISQTDVLMAIAADLASSHPDFDTKRFKKSLLGPAGKDLFRQDFREAQYLGIRRSPTVLLKAGGKTIMLRGYQPWDVLHNTFTKLQQQDQ
jgi:putative protein-disulfide isomerase